MPFQCPNTWKVHVHLQRNIYKYEWDHIPNAICTISDISAYPKSVSFASHAKICQLTQKIRLQMLCSLIWHNSNLSRSQIKGKTSFIPTHSAESWVSFYVADSSEWDMTKERKDGCTNHNLESLREIFICPHLTAANIYLITVAQRG